MCEVLSDGRLMQWCDGVDEERSDERRLTLVTNEEWPNAEKGRGREREEVCIKNLRPCSVNRNLTAGRPLRALFP